MKMSLLPEELVRQLQPMAALYPQLRLHGAGFDMRVPYGTVSMRLQSRQPLALGMMRLPVTEATLVFSDNYPQEHISRFIAAMRRICARGGG